MAFKLSSGEVELACLGLVSSFLRSKKKIYLKYKDLIVSSEFQLQHLAILSQIITANW